MVAENNFGRPSADTDVMISECFDQIALCVGVLIFLDTLSWFFSLLCKYKRNLPLQ